MSRKYIISLAFYFLIYSVGCYSFENYLSVSIVDNNNIEIKKNNSNHKYKFNFSINGYEVNCNGSKMILWGYPLNFNEGSPADNNYVLLDIINKVIIDESSMGHGIFGVNFLKDESTAFLDSGEGYLINLKKGALKKADGKTIDDLDNLLEKCTKPNDWKFNKFPG